MKLNLNIISCLLDTNLIQTFTQHKIKILKKYTGYINIFVEE